VEPNLRVLLSSSDRVPIPNGSGMGGKRATIGMFTVIAGNKKQYEQWLKEWGYSGDMQRRKSDFTYVDRPERLRGLNGGSKIVLVGTYWESPVYKSQELHIALKLSRARPLVFGDENLYEEILQASATIKLLTHYANLLAPLAARVLRRPGGKVLDLLLRVCTELKMRGVLVDYTASWGFELPRDALKTGIEAHD